MKNKISLILTILFCSTFFNYSFVNSFQQEGNKTSKQVEVEINIDETSDNQTDRTITISGDSNDVRKILGKVVESEVEKTTEDIQSKLGFQTDEEWNEYMKTEPSFQVKVTVKIDKDIPDDVIIISLRSANNYENQEINVMDGKKQKVEFHVNDFIYSEYDICVIGKTTKDVYDCNTEQYDDAIEKVTLEIEK